MNKELIELLKQGTHCIEMPDNPSEKDVVLLGIITNTERRYANFKFYNIDRKGFDHNTTNIPTIPLSSFLDTPKMISVEAVIKWISDNTMKHLGKDIILPSELLTFLNTHPNVK